jgi:DNA-binding phage protein
MATAIHGKPKAKPKKKEVQDTGYHDRRLARRLEEDPEFRAEFERQSAEIAMIDTIVHQLEALRKETGVTKAQLARAVGKNPAAIRRLLTASGNPELRTVVALASELGAEVQLVPKKGAPRAVKQVARRVLGAA